jgi:N-methylhydantoinase A
MTMRYAMSIDVGGTFTDICLLDRDTGIRTFHKSFTTHADLTEGVLNAMEVAAGDHNLTLRTLLRESYRIVHGTTVATNALIENIGSKVGAIITRGFNDILYEREAGKETSPYNFHLDYPDPFVPRYLTIPVTERINAEGGEETSLDEAQAKQAVHTLQDYNVDAIAVMFLWSFSNPVHEKRMGEIISQEWPNIPFFLSHEVNPIIREYRRFISTAFDAALHKTVRDYATRLQQKLKRNEFSGQLFMVTSSGGVVGAEEIARHPVLMVDSGPSMMPVAGLNYARMEVGCQTLVCIDMGGTSFDVTYVRDGELPMTWDAKVGPERLGIYKVDVESIGAGGGSIAWVDPGGLVHVGPKSAGSEPGPACYGRGGGHPTVTDANLVLAYISPDNFLGGRVRLYPDLAQKAIKEIADRVGYDTIRTASLINNVVNTNMIAAIRELGIRKGIDPAKLPLIAGGAAAGLHALFIAGQLGMRQVIVPKSAGVLSAYGGMEANIKREFTQSYYTETAHLDREFGYARVNSILEGLENKAKSFLEDVDVCDENQRIEYFVEARYPYQVYELEVPLSASRVSPAIMAQSVQDFHQIHQRVYGTRDPSAYLECVHWKAKAIGRTISLPEPNWPLKGGGKNPRSATTGERDIWLEENGGRTRVTIYDGRKLGVGDTVEGPAIIEEPITTVLVYPKQTTLVTRLGNYLVNL